jgi:ABC-type glycerol-3-phosphate transport system substrate-binding protein
MRFRFRKWTTWLPVLCLIVAAAIGAQAQGNTVITLAVPPWVLDRFEDGTIFDDFRAQNPGVDVVVVAGSDNLFFPGPSGGVQEHLDAVKTYVALADVVPVFSFNLTVEATRSGALLDLAPLANGDVTLNSDAFLPQALQSFQWDNGLWALPVSASMELVIYDKEAFDTAGVPYPTGDWTTEQFFDTARQMTERDADGATTRYGLFANNIGQLVRILGGQPLYDSFSFPERPNLNTPENVALLEQLDALIDEGVLITTFDGNTPPNSAMTVGGLFNIQFSETELGGVPFPNNVVSLQTTGFGVSAGTPNPALAYEVAKYLTNRTELPAALFNDLAARTTLQDADQAPEEGGGFTLALDEEVAALRDELVPVAISSAELRYTDYLNDAFNKVRGNDETEARPATEVLAETQSTAEANLVAAETYSTDLVVSIPTAVPTPQLVSGEASIKFGVGSLGFGGDISPWQEAADAFAEQDPTVGFIDVRSGSFNIEQYTQNFDCFYSPLNFTYFGDYTKLLSIDPFVSADPSFDRANYINGTLSQMEREGRLWGLPLVMLPELMKYDSAQFEAAGVPLPANGEWTVDEFNDALTQLQANNSEQAPFSPAGFGNTYLLMLIGAYGGTPVQNVDGEIVIDLTSPQNVEAIRQVLDLAKDGLLKYSALATFSPVGFGASIENPIYTETIGFGLSPADEENIDRLVMYPRGSSVVPVSFSLGALFISANTLQAEACYKWLSALTQRPDLATGMPTQFTLLSDPAYVATQSPDAIAAFTAYAAAANDPNALSILNNFNATAGAFGGLISQTWMNRAFDNYVLNDADLDTELTTAQDLIDQFDACTANIPPFEGSLFGTGDNEALNAYLRQFRDCAVSIDPTTADQFPGLDD